MQLRYIRHFSQYEPGDVVTVPDGAAFDPFYLEPADDAPPPADPPADPPAPPAAQFPPAPKEM